MSAEQQQLEAGIAAMEAQRPLLGAAVVDAALAGLHARLAALRAAASPEPTQTLKQVSILFLDVVGSTTLSQRLDPEETSAVMDGVLRRATIIVQTHHGRVLQYAGDSILAVFGSEESAEDDAERAVRCGLSLLELGRVLGAEVQAAHGHVGCDVRVGVHTGGVLLGGGGGGAGDESAIRGLAVNIAARMEQTAPAGALRISRDCYLQVRGLFEVAVQAPLAVKGVDEPIVSYLVQAALDRSVASVERGLQGLRTPMVGRATEMQRMLDAVVQARQSRQLQALTLVGDAGLGKSRLLRELAAKLSMEPAGSCQVLTVRSQPDSMLRTWGLLRTLLAVQFGVADTDSGEVARRKVQDGLAPWFAERGERHAQLIGHLSGLNFDDSPHVRGLDPRSLRDQALASLRGYLKRLSANGGALPVLLFEDLHWADDGSLDLLQNLLEHAAELPLVLVMTCRPALLARRPDWGTPETLARLSPLTAADGHTLVQALLHRLEDIPAKLTELLVGQAEGNPYYMEELVRRLIDDGVITVDAPQWTIHTERLDTLRLPGTLVGLLQARLDSLLPGERLAVRHASVIGHVFWDDALHALDNDAPQALPALQRAALVKTRETSYFAGTLERQFDHHLLHQVTYDTVLKAERRVGHGAMARWLIERTKGGGAESLAMTGEHAERAGDTALAIDCFERAGNEAKKRFANTAAVSLMQRALALLGESDPARRIDLLHEIQATADTVGDRSAQEAAQGEMAAILQRHPDDMRQARLTFAMALLADRRGDATASEQLARVAFELADRSSAPQWAAMAQGQLAWLHMARQDYPGASRHIEIGLPWAGRIESETRRAETEAQLLTLSGMVSMSVSRLQEARGTLTAVLSRGEALGKPRLQLGALKNLSLVASHLGRWDEVAVWGERICALAHAIGSRSDVAGGRLQLAEAAEALGDVAAAVRWYEQALVIERAIGNRRMEAILLRYLGNSHLQQGDAQTALRCCVESQTLHQSLQEPREACEVAAISALCAVRLGQPAVALARLNATLDQLQDGLAACPANETIQLRLTCHDVMVALKDKRAGPMLDQLYADVQTRATEVTEAADRDRLIQALPTFRAIMDEHQRRAPVDPGHVYPPN